MTRRKTLGGMLVLAAALAAVGCTGFGTNCSTDADCIAQNPESLCDPTLKVCFIYSGPVVTKIQPADQTSGVPTANAEVVATFSSTVIATSFVDAGVSPGTFSVVGQAFITPGVYTVNAEATQATFVPLTGLFALGTNYDVNLTAGIVDGSGNPLLPFHSTFSTADGTWGLGGQLQPSPVGAYAMASNFYGNVVTAADLYIGNGTTLDYGLVAGVSAQGGDPILPETPNVQDTIGQEVDYPSVAISPDDLALVAWTTQPSDAGVVPVTYTALASVFDKTTGQWGLPTTLGTPDPKPMIPQVIAYNGGALAVWLQTVGPRQLILGSYYDAENGTWGTTGNIQTDNTLGASNVSVAGDLDGDALIAWESVLSDGGPSQILARFLPGSGGGPPPVVALTSGPMPSHTPHAALGLYGAYGAIVWAQQTAATDAGPIEHIFASTFEAAQTSAFAPPIQIDEAFFAEDPVVGVGANGRAHVIWQELDQTTFNYGVASANYTRENDAGWSGATILDTDPTNFVYGPNIAVDPGGNALAAWLKNTSAAGLQMFGARFNEEADAGWHGAMRLTVGVDPVQAIQPVLVVDSSGRGFALETRHPPNNYYLEFIQFQ